MFKFHPQQYVWVTDLECRGRINRCIYDGGLQHIYSVDYTTNAEPKQREFYEDELEEKDNG
jgi:hypothetical protein